jgi:hypothetical protein
MFLKLLAGFSIFCLRILDLGSLVYLKNKANFYFIIGITSVYIVRYL